MDQLCSPELRAVDTPGRSGPEVSDSFMQHTHEQVEKPGGCEDLGALNSSFTLSQGQFLL